MDKVNQKKMHAIAQHFSKYVAMAIILNDGSNPDSIICNGTISFVDTGKRQILVTCAHVYDKFLSLKDRNVILGMAGGYGRQPLNITGASVIDIERNYIDLAILELPSSCDLKSTKHHKDQTFIFQLTTYEIKCSVMARPLRLEFEGAFYHITSRGNLRDRIFIGDKDRELKRRLINVRYV